MIDKTRISTVARYISTLFFTICVVYVMFCVVYADAVFKLTIMHTANMLSNMYEANQHGIPCEEEDRKKNQCFGGMAKIYSKVMEIRNMKGASLFVDAGDFTDQGSLWFNLFKGVPETKIMNHMNYDAVTLGDSEFRVEDFVLEFLKNKTFDVVSCNGGFQKLTNESLVTKYITVNFPNGEKVGIFGYSSPDIIISRKGMKVTFHEVVPAAQAVVNQLTAIGVNKIIALSHCGWTKDETMASQLHGVDVIVGAHFSPLFYTGNPPSSERPSHGYPMVTTGKNGEQVLIVHAYKNTKYLGKLDVTFDGQGRITEYGGNPILMDKKVNNGIYNCHNIETVFK